MPDVATRLGCCPWTATTMMAATAHAVRQAAIDEVRRMTASLDTDHDAEVVARNSHAGEEVAAEVHALVARDAAVAAEFLVTLEFAAREHAVRRARARLPGVPARSLRGHVRPRQDLRHVASRRRLPRRDPRLRSGGAGVERDLRPGHPHRGDHGSDPPGRAGSRRQPPPRRHLTGRNDRRCAPRRPPTHAHVSTSAARGTTTMEESTVDIEGITET